MRAELLEFLRCPACRGRLDIEVFKPGDYDEIDGGLLRCGCGANYPIWRQVPRMFPPTFGWPEGFDQAYGAELSLLGIASESTLGKEVSMFSFSAQWSIYEYGELTWELKLSERVAQFYSYFRASPDELRGKVVLDAGCGNGTLSAAIAESGPVVIALDFSNGVETAAARVKEFATTNWRNVHYVQGDVQNPPFEVETFDLVYCDGVLHHTDSTRKSFSAIAPLVNPGGSLFVWLYRTDLKGYYRVKLSFVKAARSLLQPIPQRIKKGICFGGAFVLLAWLRILRVLRLSRRRVVPLRLKAVNLYDTFTPKYAFSHLPAEVKGWFQEAGFTDARDCTIPGVGMYGFGMVGTRPTN